MATEPIASACPLCGESLADAAARCFRCEADLVPWRRFEERLAPFAVRPEEAHASRHPRRWRRWSLASAIFAAFALLGFVSGTRVGLGLAGSVPAGARALPPDPRPFSFTPSRAALPSPAIRLVVQKGDTLWRLAKTLTGRGTAWSTLWPETATDRVPVLRPGAVLVVPVERLAASVGCKEILR